MLPEKQNQRQNADMPEGFEPNVQNIVDQIKTKVYFEDSAVIEERLNHIQQLFEQYSIPDLGKNYRILNIWPFKPACILLQRVFRRLYYSQSQPQREAFALLLDEVRSLHHAVQGGVISLYAVHKENKWKVANRGIKTLPESL